MIEHSCDEMKSAHKSVGFYSEFLERDVDQIVFYKRLRKWVAVVSGEYGVVINYCPYCGVHLTNG